MNVAASGAPEAVLEYRKGEFLISTDRARLDLTVIHGFLTTCYWAKGIPPDVVARSIEHTHCALAFMMEAVLRSGLRESSAIMRLSPIWATSSCWNRIAGVVSASG
jgi:hypothetical protein